MTATGRRTSSRSPTSPLPDAGPDDLLVRVVAATVNRTDIGFLTGSPYFARAFTGWPRPRHRVLGGEFAGVVDAVGSDVTAFKVGRARLRLQRGRARRAGRVPRARRRTALSRPCPTGLELGAVAPATEASHYAVGLVQAARLAGRRGPRLRRHRRDRYRRRAAPESSAPTSRLCAAPSRSTSSAGSAPSRVVDRTRPTGLTTDADVPGRARRRGQVARSGSAGGCSNPDGAYLSTDLGPMVAEPVPGRWRPAVTPGRARSSRSRRRVDQDGSACLKGLIESRRFTPVVDRTYPLDEIVEAYRYVETGRRSATS